MMKSNDMKKGTVVFMKGTGWRATIADNMRGNIRVATVEGIFTEMGSIYVWDIAYALVPRGNGDGFDRVKIELTAKQIKASKLVAAAGF